MNRSYLLVIKNHVSKCLLYSLWQTGFNEELASVWTKSHECEIHVKIRKRHTDSTLISIMLIYHQIIYITTHCASWLVCEKYKRVITKSLNHDQEQELTFWSSETDLDRSIRHSKHINIYILDYDAGSSISLSFH